jgi:hypothetical protein
MHQSNPMIEYVARNLENSPSFSCPSIYFLSVPNTMGVAYIYLFMYLLMPCITKKGPADMLSIV